MIIQQQASQSGHTHRETKADDDGYGTGYVIYLTTVSRLARPLHLWNRTVGFDEQNELPTRRILR
jgi:hypothetical protein